jgi:hypothetical protein
MVQAFLTSGLCMKTTRRIGYTRPIRLPIAPPIAPGAASCEYPYALDVGTACTGRIMIAIIEKGKENSPGCTFKYFHRVCAKAANTPNEDARNWR